MSTMNYETTKLLKEAGFKCKGYFGVTTNNLLVQEDGEYGWVAAGEGNYKGQDFNEVIEIPTLSELIKACGEDFANLSNIGIADKVGNKWVAKSYSRDKTGFDEYHSIGSTPEEAVARLWLALNKKDND